MCCNPNVRIVERSVDRLNLAVLVFQIDSDRSEVYIEMNYTPKWGIFGKIMDVLVMRMAMRSTFNKVLKGLELHVETGELIGKNGKPQLSQAAAT